MSGPAGPRDRTGIWVLPIAGGALRKLQDDARGAVLSPDNTRIAFERDTVPEIWLMNASGEELRRLVVSPPGYGISEKLAWSPDGRRIAYKTTNQIGSEVAIQSYDLKTGRTTTIFSDPRIVDFCWMRDGRLIYARQERAPNQTSSNLWEIGVDARTGLSRGQPRRLTGWSDFDFDCLAASTDSKRLSFIRKRLRSNVYVGQFNAAGRLKKPRRLTFDEWTDWPTGWSRDSKAIFFLSNRNGTLNIFRQAMSATEPRAIVTGQEEATDPRLSPDGRWILYLAWRKDVKGVRTGEGWLMRTAVAERKTEVVFPIVGYTGEAPDEQAYKRPIPAAEGNPRFRCPSVAQLPCVLSEKVQDQIVFTAFDPVRGKLRELTRIEVGRSRAAFWDLSRDGRWIAFGVADGTNGRIRLLSLAGQPEREISAGKWTNLASVAWAADGKSLFVTGWASKNPPLLHVWLNGEARLLFSARYYLEDPVPSPDGRYLAFGDVVEDSNAWVIENLSDR